MNNQDFYALALELLTLTGVLHKLAREKMEQRLATLDIGLRGVPFFLLHMLRHQEQTLSELSRKVGLDPSTLVPVIDRLEQKGLVRRGKDPHDRRRVPLSLTDEGNEIISGVPPMDEDNTLFKGLQGLGYEQAQHLVTLLRELIQHIPDGEVILSEINARVSAQQQALGSNPSDKPPLC